MPPNCSSSTRSDSCKSGPYCQNTLPCVCRIFFSCSSSSSSSFGLARYLCDCRPTTCTFLLSRSFFFFLILFHFVSFHYLILRIVSCWSNLKSSSSWHVMGKFRNCESNVLDLRAAGPSNRSLENRFQSKSALARVLCSIHLSHSCNPFDCFGIAFPFNSSVDLLNLCVYSCFCMFVCASVCVCVCLSSDSIWSTMLQAATCCSSSKFQITRLPVTVQI